MSQVHNVLRLRHAKLFQKHRFCRREDGATAIEFALLAPLFFFLILALMDMGLRLMAEQDIDAGVMSASRIIRTGQFTNKNKDDFRSLICSNLSNFTSCNKLHFQVTTLDSFRAIEQSQKMDEEDQDPSEYEDSAAGEIVLIRTIYKRKSVLPPYFITWLGGKDTQILSNVTLFQNEPF